MSKKWLFVPVQAGKYWNGGTVQTESLGGSEAAVSYTAKALSDVGEEVHVLGHFPPERLASPIDYLGVKYWSNQFFQQLLNMEWDVVVASRWPAILSQPWQTGKRYLWSHDMPYDTLEVYADALVYVSEYQMRAYQIEGHVIGNGIDPKIFRPVPVERDENVLIWASNPDRGLPVAAKIFQELRKRWPDLELHVYGRHSVYGWQGQEAIYLPNENDMQNVYLHESLPRYKLAKQLQKAFALFYPTFWPETFCITALEAEACGTPVITSPVGAMPELIKGGIISEDYVNAFSQLRNKSKYAKLSELGVTRGKNSTWAYRAQQWLELANES